eukprot:s3852_g2.t1
MVVVASLTRTPDPSPTSVTCAGSATPLGPRLSAGASGRLSDLEKRDDKNSDMRSKHGAPRPLCILYVGPSPLNALDQRMRDAPQVTPPNAEMSCRAKTVVLGSEMMTDAGRCHRVPRLPHKTKADVAKCHACPAKQARRHRAPAATKCATRASPVPPHKVKADVTECHACHTKRRQTSPSATPATQKRRGATRAPAATKCATRASPVP